ncbi:hypothetical protein ACFFRR_001056 [Megaselia abdita]
MINSVELTGTNVNYSSMFLKQIPSVLPQLDINDDIAIKESKNPFVVSLQNLDSIDDDIEKLRIEENVTLKAVEIPAEEKTVWGSGPDAYHVISFSSTGIILIVVIAVCVYIKCFKKPTTLKFQVPKTT